MPVLSLLCRLLRRGRERKDKKPAGSHAQVGGVGLGRARLHLPPLGLLPASQTVSPQQLGFLLPSESQLGHTQGHFEPRKTSQRKLAPEVSVAWPFGPVPGRAAKPSSYQDAHGIRGRLNGDRRKEQMAPSHRDPEKPKLRGDGYDQSVHDMSWALRGL